LLTEIPSEYRHSFRFMGREYAHRA
jgi:hypothetical protein